VIRKVPAEGAATSVVAFSVSSSKTGSSARTASPSFLNQREIVPSVIDSPTAGTLISMAMLSPLWTVSNRFGLGFLFFAIARRRFAQEDLAPLRRRHSPDQ